MVQTLYSPHRQAKVHGLGFNSRSTSNIVMAWGKFPACPGFCFLNQKIGIKLLSEVLEWYNYVNSLPCSWWPCFLISVQFKHLLSASYCQESFHSLCPVVNKYYQITCPNGLYSENHIIIPHILMPMSRPIHVPCFPETFLHVQSKSTPQLWVSSPFSVGPGVCNMALTTSAGYFSKYSYSKPLLLCTSSWVET